MDDSITAQRENRGTFRQPLMRALLLSLASLTMAGLVLEHGQVPLEVQNAYLFLLMFPVAMGAGLLAGLGLRRPAAGPVAFAAIWVGAFVGSMVVASLDPVADRSSYGWYVATGESVLQALVLAAPGGAVGYAIGSVKRGWPQSRALGVVALALGFIVACGGILTFSVGYFSPVHDAGAIAWGLIFLLSGGLLLIGFADSLRPRAEPAEPSRVG